MESRKHSSRYSTWPISAYCVEEAERQQFREVSDLQAVGDRSTAAVLVSLGWQSFVLNVNVPAFFNTIGQKQPLPEMAFRSSLLPESRP